MQRSGAPRQLAFGPTLDATALLMIKRYRNDTRLETAARADQLQEDRDWQGAIIWHRVHDCIERIQAMRPADAVTMARLGMLAVLTPCET
jgi:hypothetical protein